MNEAYVWSILLAPIRSRVPDIVLSWYYKKFTEVPTHTFVTLGKVWHTEEILKRLNGYWYCAGDFCSTYAFGINGYKIGKIDLNYTSCLVRPNIKKNHSQHHIEVIGGSYGIDYVCHNITNRILSSAEKPLTLANTTLKLAGYKLIIKSPLGLYGRNEREWLLCQKSCAPNKPPSIPTLSRTVDEEVDLLHARAVEGKGMKKEDITKALYAIDNAYEEQSIEIFDKLDNKKITKLQFDEEMQNLISQTLDKSEIVIGKELTDAIYGQRIVDDKKDIVDDIEYEIEKIISEIEESTPKEDNNDLAKEEDSELQTMTSGKVIE